MTGLHQAESYCWVLRQVSDVVEEPLPAPESQNASQTSKAVMNEFSKVCCYPAVVVVSPNPCSARELFIGMCSECSGCAAHFISLECLLPLLDCM